MFVIVNHVRGRAHTSLGQHIRRYRAQRDLIQEHLAASGGKKRVTIIRYELDAIDTPLSVLVAIAQALKVPPSQLLNGDQRVPPSVQATRGRSTPPPVSPGSLTPSALAANWCLGRSTVYGLIARGHLPFYRLGGSIRVKWADVRAYEKAVYQAAVIHPKRLGEKWQRVQAATRGTCPQTIQGVEA